MKAFRRTLEDCHLKDIGYSRVWFTWERGRLLENIIRERIDRGVATNAWIQLFPNYSLRHLPQFLSDHCSLLLETEVGDSRQKLRRFHFEASWILKESCENEVGRLWNGSSGSFISRVYLFLRGCRAEGARLNKEEGMMFKD